ncbi:MAG: hypothetical protein Q9169_007773 [Polycauliona sp. 2 TL-2023]
MNNYYEVLGLKEDVTHEAIWQHYVLLTIDDKTRDIYKIDESLSEQAFETLTDPGMRAEHDKALEHRRNINRARVAAAAKNARAGSVSKRAKVRDLRARTAATTHINADPLTRAPRGERSKFPGDAKPRQREKRTRDASQAGTQGISWSENAVTLSAGADGVAQKSWLHHRFSRRMAPDLGTSPPEDKNELLRKEGGCRGDSALRDPQGISEGERGVGLTHWSLELDATIEGDIGLDEVDHILTICLAIEYLNQISVTAMVNLYAVFGIQEQATDDEIYNAWRKMRKRPNDDTGTDTRPGFEYPGSRCNFYTVLGVDQDATLDEIILAYDNIRLAPDGLNDGRPRDMELIDQAFGALTDRNERATYDDKIKNNPKGEGRDSELFRKAKNTLLAYDKERTKYDTQLRDGEETARRVAENELLSVADGAFTEMQLRAWNLTKSRAGM